MAFKVQSPHHTTWLFVFSCSNDISELIEAARIVLAHLELHMTLSIGKGLVIKMLIEYQN